MGVVWQNALVVTGGIVSVACIAWPILSWLQVKNLEKPKYVVVKTLGSAKGFWTGKHLAELRQYAPYVVAEVEVEQKENMRQAMSSGFRQVAGYIFGKNSASGGKSESIAMTSPVRTEKVEKSESIAMTSPVRTEMAGPGTYRISFVMPSKYTLATLPTPENPAVKFREVAPATVAALSFSGPLPTSEMVAAKGQQLRDIMQAEGLTAEGEPMLYSYYPPFAPSWMRHTEVLLKVAE